MQRVGASLAFSTLFAIAPVLLVAVGIAGFVFDEAATRERIAREAERLVGPDGALAVQALLRGAAHQKPGLLAGIVGAATLVLAATGAYLDLQAALNRIWRVKPKSRGFDVRALLFNRVRSFGLVLATGFLLLVSLVISAALAALTDWLNHVAPAPPFALRALNIALSAVISTVLFAFLFRFLPDVRLRWPDVWTGAIVTAILFSVGKELLGLYLGQSAIASSYGAAGSVIVLLMWVYYSSQIVLFGAELTRLVSTREHGTPETEPFATRAPSPSTSRP